MRDTTADTFQNASLKEHIAIADVDGYLPTAMTEQVFLTVTGSITAISTVTATFLKGYSTATTTATPTATVYVAEDFLTATTTVLPHGGSMGFAGRLYAVC